MLRRTIILLILSIILIPLKAQIRDNLKLELEVGFPIRTDSDNFGLLLNVEPKLKVAEHVFVGMRIAMAMNTQSFDNKDSSQFIIDKQSDHGFISIIPTCSYYWQLAKFNPYVGIGIGPYSLANNIDVFRINTKDPLENTFEIELRNQIGFLLRAGAESGKISFGLEYNIVPKINVESPEGQKVGMVNSSYLGITLGWLIVS